ncbi:MAG TPA: response regulator [Dehalococcoidia bacterium]|nr:response regulator [Dehalococcoidia bacterium]
MAGTFSDSGPRILLIEDEPAVARLTELILNGAGYTVQVAENHATAIRLLADHAYGLILADTDRGPQTTGLAGLASLLNLAPCPVVLFTAHRFSDSEISAAGFAGVVRKPYDIDDLLRVVKEALTHGAPNGNMTAPV